MGSNQANIEVHCELCGDDDSSMHLGLHMDSSAYACWRDESHRGRNPTRIIKALLGISWNEAKVLSQEYFKWQHESAVAAVEGDPVPTPPLNTFRKFDEDPQLERQFKQYIKSRGIDPNYAITRYDMRWCVRDYFAYRLIVPVVSESKWWTWQGRTITDSPVRYLAAGEEFTKNKPNDYLFDVDNLQGGKCLLVVEGAWDAIKVNSALIQGVSATALFGKVIRPKQMLKLVEIAANYDMVAIGLDKDALTDSLAMQDRLQWFLPSVKLLTPSGKDWGVMPQTQIKQEVMSIW